MSILTSKPKHELGDMVNFKLELTYKDCDGKIGKVNQLVTGEVVGLFCDVKCVSNEGNNWHYYIARSGMRHLREEYEMSSNNGL